MEKNVVTKLEDLNLINRFLFDEVMEDRESYQATVSILLGEDIQLLDEPETEKELRVSPELREIRLDVVSMDKGGKLYYTEMQQKNTKNLRRRSRYYQAQLDVSLLAPGSKDFNLLNDSCLILVAPFDIFERGLYRYTFATFCKECPDLKLEDGATRVFINTKGKNKWVFSQEFLDFMEYLTNTTDEVAEKTESCRIKRIHEQVKRIRLSEKMGVKYMQLWEEKAYIREEGYEEGDKKRLIHTICKKLRKGKALEQIADEVEESLDLVRGICLVAQKEAPDYDCDKIYEILYGAELTIHSYK